MFTNIYKDFQITKNVLQFQINGENIRIRTHDSFFNIYHDLFDEIPKLYIAQGYI